jgi:glycosyltransferase involved in cell wall biosynthesis
MNARSISPISAILPARNEQETIERAVASLAAQPEIAEIIVVNDQSTDGTAAILQGLTSRFPHVRVLEAPPLPADWIGKNHAASLGVAAASPASSWLLFTDADTFHLPGAARRALADAGEHGADLVSYSPEQELPSRFEKIMIPFVYIRLVRKFSFERVCNPAWPDAAANGQFLLLTRDAYRAAGGHEAIRDKVLEDVELARRVKSAGFRLYFAPGNGIVRTRMYPSFAAMWEGWTKNLYLLAGGTPRAALREIVLAFPWLGIGLLALAAFGWGMEPAPHIICAVLGGILLAMDHAVYAAQLSRNLYSRSLIQYYVPGAALYVAALLVSAWRNTWGSVVWKGRVYPAGTPS